LTPGDDFRHVLARLLFVVSGLRFALVLWFRTAIQLTSMEETMKLRILVVFAGCLMLPVMAGAQDTTTVKKDTTVKTDTAVAPTTVPTTVMTPPTTTDTSGPNTPTGKECPKGCPTSKGAAGLSGVQFLALQQELRDRGCGNSHVTGRLDGPTRGAIRTCAQRLNVANNARAVLIAMNIGFSETDIPAPATD
jgi:hypothetical protein